MRHPGLRTSCKKQPAVPIPSIVDRGTAVWLKFPEPREWVMKMQPTDARTQQHDH